MRTWADVAILAKTRNSDGRFAARAAAGLPFLLEKGMEVSFVPPVLDAPRQAIVKRVAPIDDAKAEVTFEGVGEEEAQLLIGAHCLVRRSSLPRLAIERSSGAWQGFSVVDEAAGDVGRITGVVENPAQTLLEVERTDGTTVLVPAVDEIVLEVDAKAGIVNVNLPNGLLDL